MVYFDANWYLHLFDENQNKKVKEDMKNMEILCKKILTTLLIYSKIAMFECWLLSLAPIFADCVGCIFLSDIGSVQQVLLLIVYWLEGEFSNENNIYS